MEIKNTIVFINTTNSTLCCLKVDWTTENIDFYMTIPAGFGKVFFINCLKKSRLNWIILT